MPIKKGYSRKTISENISEILRSWKKTGRIGTSRPKTLAEAKKQAVAIAMETARKARGKRRLPPLAYLLRPR